MKIPLVPPTDRVAVHRVLVPGGALILVALLAVGNASGSVSSANLRGRFLSRDATALTLREVRDLFAGQAQYPGLDVKASVGIADFNGDGRIDLLSQSHFVLFGRGDGKFVPGPRFALPFALISSQTLADLNLDGVANWVRVERLGGIGVEGPYRCS